MCSTSVAIRSWTFVCWEIFDYCFSFNADNWSIHIFLFLPDSVFGEYTFLEICLFSLHCPFYWYIIVVITYDPLCFCDIVIFPFSLNILFELSLSILMSLAKGLSILFIFSKNQFLVSLIFSDFKLVSISFIFALIFIMSFFLLIEFFFFFFYFIRCEVKLRFFFFVLSFCLCIWLCLPLVAACGLFLRCEGPCLAVARGLRVHDLPGVVCA